MADQPQSLSLHLPAWMSRYLQTADTFQIPTQPIRFILGAVEHNITHKGVA